jgi:hypothetical protein
MIDSPVTTMFCPSFPLLIGQYILPSQDTIRKFLGLSSRTPEHGVISLPERSEEDRGTNEQLLLFQ